MNEAAFGCLTPAAATGPSASHPPTLRPLLPPTLLSLRCQGYRDWCRHVNLPERVLELELETLRKGGEVVVRAMTGSPGLGTLLLMCCCRWHAPAAAAAACCWERPLLVWWLVVLPLPLASPSADDTRACPCLSVIACPLQEWEFLLEELSLWFLMYSEGANLRHTPEAMWFLYWCLRNSHERQMQITVPPPTDPRSAAYIGAPAGGAFRLARSAALERGGRCLGAGAGRGPGRGVSAAALIPPCTLLPAARTPELARDLVKLRIHLRNKYQAQLAGWRREAGARPDGEMRGIQELVRGVRAGAACAACAAALHAMPPAHMLLLCLPRRPPHRFLPTLLPPRLPPYPPAQADIHAGAKRAIAASGVLEAGQRGREANMLAEMVAYGDSGAFLDKASLRLAPITACCCLPATPRVGWLGRAWQAACPCPAAGEAARHHPPPPLAPATSQTPAAGHPHLLLPGARGGQEGDGKRGDWRARGVRRRQRKPLHALRGAQGTCLVGLMGRPPACMLAASSGLPASGSPAALLACRAALSPSACLPWRLPHAPRPSLCRRWPSWGCSGTRRAGGRWCPRTCTATYCWSVGISAVPRCSCRASRQLGVLQPGGCQDERAALLPPPLARPSPATASHPLPPGGHHHH